MRQGDQPQAAAQRLIDFRRGAVRQPVRPKGPDRARRYAVHREKFRRRRLQDGLRCSEAVDEALEQVVSDPRYAFQVQPGKNPFHAVFPPAATGRSLKVKTPFKGSKGETVGARERRYAHGRHLFLARSSHVSTMGLAT